MTSPDDAAAVGTGDMAEVVRRLDELQDLFRRRLLDDRESRRALDVLQEQLRQSRDGPFREYVAPLVLGIALVVDRLDRYDGPDAGFVESVRAELLDVVSRQGVAEVAGSGEFDPEVHEAVETRAVTDSPAGHVVELRRRGYTHGSWVFRPAQVVVAERPGEGP